MKKTKLIIITILFLVIPSIVGAVTPGEVLNFNIDPSYDLTGRKEISAILVKITKQLYFYAGKDWWESLDYSNKKGLDVELYNLASEFEKKIYPTLTSIFGSEPKPGIDKDERITILIHPMSKEAGGYTNSGDSYLKLQNPNSNEREMVYLNSRYIDKPEAKSFLAHEFVHLITVNQKDLLRDVTEETWLNEARAEYAPTLLGYDGIYKGSNLEKRVKSFLEEPNDSLTEWRNQKEDYGVVNLFVQYLVDRYGSKVLIDSLHSSKIGIPSINDALAKNSFKTCPVNSERSEELCGEDFNQIFVDWTIAVLVNDCKLGERYCYLNENLKNLRITPTLYYLPLRTESILSTFHTATYWSSNWHKFIGGGSSFALEFDGVDSVGFEVPYLLCDLKGDCLVKFLILDNQQKGEIAISDFSATYSSLTIIPFIKSKTSGFDGRENSFSFSWKVSVREAPQEDQEAELIKQLLTRIEELKRQIAELQAKINAILASRGQKITCPRFERDLYFGMMNVPEVFCLQEFLKSQGLEIYPEGLVSGNFLSLTQSAVIRFQEKYSDEILKPLGLERGTGFVGAMTRAKINQLLNF